MSIAARITIPADGSEVALHSGAASSLTIATAGEAVYVGPTGVTKATGFIIPPATRLTLPMSTDDLFAVGSGRGTQVSVLAMI